MVLDGIGITVFCTGGGMVVDGMNGADGTPVELTGMEKDIYIIH